MIGAHPRVLHIAKEAHAMADFAEIAQNHSTGERAAYRQKCLALGLQDFYQMLAEQAFQSFAGAFARRGWFPERNGPVTHWCAKTKPGPQSVEGFELLFPSVRHVHIVRDGREVVYSRTKYPGFRDLSFPEQCEAWRSEVDYYSTLRAAGGVCLVRHEDLIQEPERTVARLLKFCGLPDDPAPLKCLRTEHVHPLNERTMRVESVLERMQSRTPAWDTFSEEQRGNFRAICGPSMEQLGYALR